MSIHLPRPWRAFHTFQTSLAASLLLLTVALMVSVLLQLTQGQLAAEQTRVLLAIMYWGAFPLVFVAVVSLLVHVVRAERGDYA